MVEELFILHSSRSSGHKYSFLSQNASEIVRFFDHENHVSTLYDLGPIFASTTQQRSKF